jgi:hypothetical protein
VAGSVQVMGCRRDKRKVVGDNVFVRTSISNHVVLHADTSPSNYLILCRFVSRPATKIYKLWYEKHLNNQ